MINSDNFIHLVNICSFSTPISNQKRDVDSPTLGQHLVFEVEVVV